MWQHITKALLSLFLFRWKYLGLGSKLTFPICWKAGYKGWIEGCKKQGIRQQAFQESTRFYLWLLPFSKDSSSSSLFSRSLLFMKGNFLLKLIFCFALGPRLRVPVDLNKQGLLLFYESTQMKPFVLCRKMHLELQMNTRAWHREQELDIESGLHGDTLRVHVTWKRNCQADVKTRHA